MTKIASIRFEQAHKSAGTNQRELAAVAAFKAVVQLRDGGVVQIGIWTYAYLNELQQTPSGDNRNASSVEYLVPPDLLVADGSIAAMTNIIESEIDFWVRPHWFCEL